MDEQKIKTQFEKLKRVERTQKRESTQRGCGAAWQPLRRRKTSLDYTLIAGITLEAVYYTIKYEMALLHSCKHSHIQYIHHPILLHSTTAAAMENSKDLKLDGQTT